MRESAGLALGSILSLTTLACTHARGPSAEDHGSSGITGAEACPKPYDGPGSDTPARLRFMGPLALSEEAREELRGRRTVVEVMLDTTGRPVPCTFRIVESPDPRLTAAARTALLGARFHPATLKGELVQMWVRQAFEVE